MDVGTFAFKIWKWICIKIWNSPWKPKITGYWDFKVFKVFFPFLFLVSPALLQSNVQNFLGAQVGVEIKMDIGISLPNLIIFLMKWTFILISIQRQCPFLFFFCFHRRISKDGRSKDAWDSGNDILLTGIPSNETGECAHYVLLVCTIPFCLCCAEVTKYELFMTSLGVSRNTEKRENV